MAIIMGFFTFPHSSLVIMEMYVRDMGKIVVKWRKNLKPHGFFYCYLFSVDFCNEILMAFTINLIKAEGWLASYSHIPLILLHYCSFLFQFAAIVMGRAGRALTGLSRITFVVIVVCGGVGKERVAFRRQTVTIHVSVFHTNWIWGTTKNGI